MEREREQQLIEAIKTSGCQDAYATLLEELDLYRGVYFFLRRYLHDQEAKEATQETLFRTILHMHSFDPSRGRFRSWVYGIALHQAYDRLAERTYDCLEELPELPMRQSSPEEQIVLMEMGEAFLGAISRLNARYRQVLVDFYVEGLSLNEIASQEDTTTNNIGTLLHRARQQCSQLYESSLEKQRASRRGPNASPPWSQETRAFAGCLASLRHRFLGASPWPWLAA